MTNITECLADALVQAAMEGDFTPKVTVSMRVLEILACSAPAVEARELSALVELNHVDPSALDREAVAARLKLARKVIFRSAAAAARHLDLNEVTVRAHEAGQNRFGVEQAKAYACAYRVSLAWLLLGEGEA